MMPNTEIYNLKVNGKNHEVRDAWVGESLLYVLRERLTQRSKLLKVSHLMAYSPRCKMLSSPKVEFNVVFVRPA